MPYMDAMGILLVGIPMNLLLTTEPFHFSVPSNIFVLLEHVWRRLQDPVRNVAQPRLWPWQTRQQRAMCLRKQNILYIYVYIYMRFNPSKFKMDVDTTPHNTVYRVWRTSSVQNLDVIKLDIPFTINVQSSLNFLPLPKYEQKNMQIAF